MFSWSRPSLAHPEVAPSATGRKPQLSTVSRDTHLSSYLNHPILKPSTRKVSVDDTVYDTLFQTTNGFALVIRVYVPMNSSTPPSMNLHGVHASHEWLDIRMKVIGYAPISSEQSWISSKLELGDAVYAVIQHFQVNPPVVFEIRDETLRRVQENISEVNRPEGSTNSAPPEYPRPNHKYTTMSENRENGRRVRNEESIDKKSVTDVNDEEVNALIPLVPSSFPQIDTMTSSQVKQLFDDESLLKAFVEQTSIVSVSTLTELKQSIEKANVSAANANLIYQERIDALHAELELLKQDLHAKIQHYRSLEDLRLEFSCPPDTLRTIQELSLAKKDAYRVSEGIAENWIESDPSLIGDFVKTFLETRTLYHTRASKAERLSMSM